MTDIDINELDSEKKHLKTETMRLYKSWKICKNENHKRFLAEQFNKIAEMYINRER